MQTDAVGPAVALLLCAAPSTGPVESAFSHLELMSAERKATTSADHLRAAMKVRAHLSA